MNLRPDDPQLVEFTRHMVTLLMDVVVTSDQTLSHQTDNASGFLTSIDGRWFIVTAGHVLVEQLSEYHERGWLRSLYLCDAWSDPNDGGRGRPLPLPIEPDN
jgi:hypothetical protein